LPFSAFDGHGGAQPLLADGFKDRLGNPFHDLKPLGAVILRGGLLRRFLCCSASWLACQQRRGSQ
jgi:hypothetical protein